MAGKLTRSGTDHIEELFYVDLITELTRSIMQSFPTLTWLMLSSCRVFIQSLFHLLVSIMLRLPACLSLNGNAAALIFLRKENEWHRG